MVDCKMMKKGQADKPKIIKVSDIESVKRSTDALHCGGVVAIPTDTIYGKKSYRLHVSLSFLELFSYRLCFRVVLFSR